MGAAGSLAQVAEMSLPALKQMNKAVIEFEKRYGSTTLHPSLALALNVSGRQRMLTQKASKEFCLIAFGHDVEQNREALKGTVALFEKSLAALMDGDDDLGLPEAPTDEIYDQLELVNGLWEPLSVVFKKVAAGENPSGEDLTTIATGNNPALFEMNKAVGMYENL